MPFVHLRTFAPAKPPQVHVSSAHFDWSLHSAALPLDEPPELDELLELEELVSSDEHAARSAATATANETIRVRMVIPLR